ncbi:MAG: CCA tRNA nucleotidyltransferase [Candidatus Omnitrophica bacterium]|nr:CCA tRNA nucleotidyltransferase [Candidatus Omnitrophota bacterium]
MKIKINLPRNISSVMRKIGNIADANGLAVYLVGGCVRDILLEVENLDLDIVVEGNALEFIKLLRSEIDLDVLTHPRFGTATVTLPNGFKIDFTSARKENYAHPAALPSVTFSSINDDLFRRDFSINALAAKIDRSNFGQLLDLFEGQKDLKAARVRILHDQSFIDDPTRIVRAIRFAQRYNFRIESETLKLMRQAIASGLLKKISRFRLGREFILLLKEKQPLPAIELFDQLCGLKIIHPMIKLDKIAKAGLKARPAKSDWLVYFSLLTRKLNAEQLEKLCCDFCLTRIDKRRLKALRSEGSILR